MEYFGLIFGMIAIGIALSVQAQLATLKRKQKEKENGMRDSVVLKNTLKNNVGKEVKFTFYESNNLPFANDIIYTESELSFRVLDFDETYVLTQATLIRRKKTISKQVLLPIENIRSVETNTTVETETPVETETK
ncbi:MAG: hypothetical protein J5993_04610 [Clostridia bacterium]|nr:hypothetical protein [Clostridia bacterium]